MNNGSFDYKGRRIEIYSGPMGSRQYWFIKGDLGRGRAFVKEIHAIKTARQLIDAEEAAK